MEQTSSKKTFFRILLLVLCLVLVVYTYFTVQLEGWNFLGASVEYLQSMQWKGQFSLDFFCYLLLSVLWVLWRNNFSLNSVLPAFFAMAGGFIFFSVYLVYLITKEEGDMRKVLLGKHY